MLPDELKLLVTFTVRRHEAPDVRHLLARGRGQFGDGDNLFDVMHVPLWRQGQRSHQDPARQLKAHGKLPPHLPVFNTGFSLRFSLFFFLGFHLTQLLLRSHGRAAHSGSPLGLASPWRQSTRCYNPPHNIQLIILLWQPNDLLLGETICCCSDGTPAVREGVRRLGVSVLISWATNR